MFWTRLMSSVVLVIAALVLLLSGDLVLLLGTLLLSLAGFHELTAACGVASWKKAESVENGKETVPDAGESRRKGGGGTPNGLMLVGYAGIFLYDALLYLSGEAIYQTGILAAVFLGMMAVYVLTFPRFSSGQVMNAFFCFFYAPVLFSFVFLTRSLPGGIYLVWLIFISSWICDTFAYLTGMAFGKHKLTPVLSPKKSVEGAVGGVAGSALVGALFGRIFLERVIPDPDIIWITALLSGAGAVVSQIGDLAASGIKRNHGIKDYGKLIPGHGGIMDRFDSVLFTAPIIYYLAILLIRFE